MAQRGVKTVTGNVVIAASGTTATTTIGKDGMIKAILIAAPVMTGTTYTVTVTGPATGFTLFSKAGISVNANTAIIADANNVLLNIPISSDSTITILSNGTEASQRTIPYTLLIQTF